MWRRSASSASPPTITYRFSVVASAERALQLLEEAFVRLVRAVVGVRVELREQAALLLAQVARDDDVHEHALVAAPEALEDGHAAPAQRDDLAGLRAGGEVQIDVALERRNRKRRAERSLRHRQVDGGEDVVALAHEPWIGQDAHLHVDVARTRAELPDMTLAAEPDALAVVDARRDRHLEAALLEHASRTLAIGAWRLDAPA